MHTTRTTTLSDDPATAQAEFEHWVHRESVVLLVLLGTGRTVEATIQDADKMANKLSNLAHVLWARNPSHLEDQLAALQGERSLLNQLPRCQGFSLSLTDKVVDVLRHNEAPPDLTRLLELFTNALDKAGVRA